MSCKGVIWSERISFDFIKKNIPSNGKGPVASISDPNKKEQRLYEFANYYGKFPDHVWIGVSVETAAYKRRIDDLKAVNAKIHFLSLEPLLGPSDKLDLDHIEWVIAGGESGFNLRMQNRMVKGNKRPVFGI